MIQRNCSSVALFAFVAAAACASDVTFAEGDGGSTSPGTESSSGGGVFLCQGARWHAADLIVDASTDVEGLRDIGGVEGSVRVRDTDQLYDLEFFECLEEVRGNLSIRGNAQLQSLSGLENLSTMGTSETTGLPSSSIVLEDNPELVAAVGLSVREVRFVGVSGNAALTTLEMPALTWLGELALGGCIEQPGYIPEENIVDNQSLGSVGSYPQLKTLGNLYVEGQSGLSSLDSLMLLVDQGAAISGARFHKNAALPASEIDAFAAAANIDVLACENQGQGEVQCQECFAD